AHETAGRACSVATWPQQSAAAPRPISPIVLAFGLLRRSGPWLRDPVLDDPGRGRLGVVSPSADPSLQAARLADGRGRGQSTDATVVAPGPGGAGRPGRGRTGWCGRPSGEAQRRTRGGAGGPRRAVARQRDAAPKPRDAPRPRRAAPRGCPRGGP